MKSTTGKQVYLIIITLIVWFGLLLQFRLSLKELDGAVWPTFKILLSFFTVLTNLAVAICLTASLLLKNTALGRFFSKPATQTAITVYIVVVAIIYNTALRGLVPLEGWHSLSNELLHVINPLLFLVYWIVFVDKTKLAYPQALYWLIYPFLYVVFIVVRGYLINQYPYPFINVVKLGYPKAILNTAIIMVIFWALSLLFIFLGKKTSKP
ncbi:Pr6Pr family membrane protein [Pedobacter sp. GSP4]|uniref:Pr6Pr family membrane protein n=1 Tax=Pedobacter sp. GSP4 TaxID=3453716 RepID=UPI003EEDB4ED